MKALISAVMLCAVVQSAAAGETEWQQVDEDARMRMVFSDVREPDGTTWAALEIDMPADTKTYWRVPGETGIPLTLDIDGSRGVTGADLAWPFPTRETSKGYLDHVYYGDVVLPLKLATTGESPLLETEVMLGVCSDVCVPVFAMFSHQLSFSGPDAGQELRIRQALAETPLPWTGESAPFGEVTYDMPDGEVAVAVKDPSVAYDTAIATIAGEFVLMGPGEAGSDGQLVFPVFAHGANPRLEGKTLSIVFMTPDGPYEITRVIASP